MKFDIFYVANVEETQEKVKERSEVSFTSTYAHVCMEIPKNRNFMSTPIAMLAGLIAKKALVWRNP